MYIILRDSDVVPTSRPINWIGIADDLDCVPPYLVVWRRGDKKPETFPLVAVEEFELRLPEDVARLLRVQSLPVRYQAHAIPGPEPVWERFIRIEDSALTAESGV